MLSVAAVGAVEPIKRVCLRLSVKGSLSHESAARKKKFSKDPKK